VNFEAALAQELATISSFGGRVYPLHDPEATKHNGIPYCIYRSSDGVRDKTLGGYQSGKQVSGEVNVVATSYASMKSVAHAVVELLISMERRVIGTGGPFIQELTYEQPVELYEEAPKLYRGLIDFTVYFEEGS